MTSRPRTSGSRCGSRPTCSRPMIWPTSRRSRRPTWDLVEKARAVLVDHAQRGRYHDWLRQKLPELRTTGRSIRRGPRPRFAAMRARPALSRRRRRSQGDERARQPRAATTPATRSTRPAWRGRATGSRSAPAAIRVAAAVVERKALDELLLGRRPVATRAGRARAAVRGGGRLSTPRAGTSGSPATVDNPRPRRCPARPAARRSPRD